jgi:DNA-binding NarL/FixJ family response regulator
MMLTPRQVEIARLLASGLKYEAIGARLGITERTVRFHVTDAAARLPGRGAPRVKLVIFVTELTLEERRSLQAS